MTMKRALLSPRQLDVLRCIADGMSDKQAAKCLGMALPTVKTHCVGIFHSLDVHTRAGAVMKAVRLGLLSPYEAPLQVFIPERDRERLCLSSVQATQ